MDLAELRTADAELAEEVAEDEETDEPDTQLEDNLTEACERLDALLSLMEEVVYVPKGRKIQRLPRNFKDVMEEAAEFLEDVDYEREGAAEDNACDC